MTEGLPAHLVLWPDEFFLPLADITPHTDDAAQGCSHLLCSWVLSLFLLSDGSSVDKFELHFR